MLKPRDSHEVMQICYARIVSGSNNISTRCDDLGTILEFQILGWALLQCTCLTISFTCWIVRNMTWRERRRVRIVYICDTIKICILPWTCSLWDTYAERWHPFPIARSGSLLYGRPLAMAPIFSSSAPRLSSLVGWCNPLAAEPLVACGLVGMPSPYGTIPVDF